MANAYGGSNPPLATTVLSGSSSVGGASAFQAEGRGFEPRLPLQKEVSRTVWRAHVAQLAERVLGKDEVSSSILLVGSRPGIAINRTKNG